MSLKPYDNDYQNPIVPGGTIFIEGQEALDIDYMYESILHMNKFLLKSGADLCQLFRKKIVGTRCTNIECPAHNNYQQEGSDDCPVCFGTGFVDGYDFLGEILVRFAPDMETYELTAGGLLRKIKPRTWTMPDPEIRKFDILINFSQPQMIGQKIEVDMPIIRGTATLADSLNEIVNTTRQVVRILKISDTRNASPYYKEGIDYVLDNNGVLWKDTVKPIDAAEYYVTYQITHNYFRRYAINDVTQSRWRGKTLHQQLETTELSITHPSYLIAQHATDSTEAEYVANPFPQSEWYDRP